MTKQATTKQAITKQSMSRRMFLQQSGLFGAALALAACQPVSNAPAGTTTEGGAPAAAPVNITHMAWGAEGSDVLPAVAESFQAEQGDITVEVSSASFADYWTRLNTLYASGTPPEAASTHTAWMQTHVELGVLADLNPYIEATADFPTDWIAPSQALFEFNGGRYGINYDFAVSGIWWNPGLFEQAGTGGTPAAGWTLDNVQEWGALLTTDQDGNHPDASGFNPRAVTTWATSGLLGGWSNTMRPQALAYGADFYNADNTASTITDPATLEFLQWRYDSIHSWYLHPTVDLAESVGNLFVAGNSAVTAGFPELMNEIGDAFAWDVAPYPQGPNGRPTLNVGGSAHSLPAASSQPDAAWKWITYNTSDVAHGIWASFGYLNARQSTALLAIEKNENVSPNFKTTFVDGATEYGVPVWQHVNRAQIEQVLNSEFELVWLGQRSVVEAAEAAKPQVDELLLKSAA